MASANLKYVEAWMHEGREGEEVRRKTFPVTSSAFLRAPHSIPRAQTRCRHRREGADGGQWTHGFHLRKKGRTGRRRSQNLKRVILPEYLWQEAPCNGLARTTPETGPSATSSSRTTTEGESSFLGGRSFLEAVSPLVRSSQSERRKKCKESRN